MKNSPALGIDIGGVLALQTWAGFGECFACCTAWTVNMIDPDIVVLGGSLSKGFKYFAPAMETHLRKWINPVPAQELKKVVAELQDLGSMVGAACLALV
jgi:glucokinase